MLYLNDYLIATLAQERLADLRRKAEVEHLWHELSRSQSNRSSHLTGKLLKYLGGLLVKAGEGVAGYGARQVTTLTQDHQSMA